MIRQTYMIVVQNLTTVSVSEITELGPLENHEKTRTLGGEVRVQRGIEMSSHHNRILTTTEVSHHYMKL
jgi:hypothetical protein